MDHGTHDWRFRFPHQATIEHVRESHRASKKNGKYQRFGRHVAGDRPGSTQPSRINRFRWRVYSIATQGRWTLHTLLDRTNCTRFLSRDLAGLRCTC